MFGFANARTIIPATTGRETEAMHHIVPLKRRVAQMQWNMILGSMVLGLGLCTQSFGFDLLDRMLGASGCGCQTSCCTSARPSCGAPACAAPAAPACAAPAAPGCA